MPEGANAFCMADKYSGALPPQNLFQPRISQDLLENRQLYDNIVDIYGDVFKWIEKKVFSYLFLLA